MKRILILLACCLFGLPFWLPAQPTNPPSAQKPLLKPAPDGERFLFIVDMSSATKKINLPTRQTVFDVIFKGLGGRMEAGDTFGVWTVTDTTHAGVYPMQVWDPDKPLELASRVGVFLREHEIRGRADFTELATRLDSVIKNAKDVNVFIFTDGSTFFKDTHIDGAINPLLSTRGKEARKARKPIIVLLVARDGQIVDSSVGLNPIGLSLPPRPPRHQAQAAPLVQPPSKREIIITKPKGTVPSDPPPAAPRPTNAAPATVPFEMDVANNPPNSPPAAPQEKAVIETPHTEPAPAVGAVQSQPPTPAETNAVVSPTALVEQKPNAPSVTPTALAAPAQPPTPVANPPAPTSVVAAVAPPAAPAPATPTSAVAVAAPAPAVNTVTQTSPPMLVVLPQPLVVAARENNPGVVATSGTPQVIAAAPQSAFGAQALLIVGCALLIVALLLLLAVLRYQRRLAQVSLITRSMNHK